MPDTPLSWPLRLLTAVFAAACATQAAPLRPAPPAAPPPPAPREHWSRFAEVSAWPPVAGAFRTQGHLIDAEHAVVRVSPEAREVYLSLVTDSSVPDGTVVAAFHQHGEGEPARGAVYVMVKSGSAWSYLALDAEGGIIERDPKGCDGCHAGAVADRLFGPPRPSRRSVP